MLLQLRVDGADVAVEDSNQTLLDVLRDQIGVTAVKDGCSPQGQCGCCTVWVDGAPRVACVTPARRVVGREVTTVSGLDPSVRTSWAEAFVDTGGSQCGFCTPGIVMRLAALAARGGDDPSDALLAHLCRCTGWQTVEEAFALWRLREAGPDVPVPGTRDLELAARRAALEGHAPQAVGAHVPLGQAGFAEDTAPADALVAVPDGAGGWALGETLHEARAAAGKVQGRRTPGALHHPLTVPRGQWDVTLRTTWVDPAYLEPDASWCAPGGAPASPLANGGAFGGKAASLAPAAARALAETHGRPVRVVLAREDVVRLGPKRPPLAAGATAAGEIAVSVARCEGIADAIRTVAPAARVEEVDVPGPPVSSALRGAGWAEIAALLAAARRDPTIMAPNGARASAEVTDDGVRIRVACGSPLDDVTLRSYCIGAAHMALGLVRSEGVAVDGAGVPQDLTIRSFGILRARDMPAVEVAIEPSEGEPVNGSDAVFAAVAAAAWLHDGLPSEWPTRRKAFPS